jgi:hypothetical protein
MNVNFNNLRKQACYSHDRLVQTLNANIYKGDEYIHMPNGNYRNLADCVIVDAEDIKKELDELRQLIATIASCYEPDDEKFAMVYPEDKPMVVFNDTEED